MKAPRKISGNKNVKCTLDDILLNIDIMMDLNRRIGSVSAFFNEEQIFIETADSEEFEIWKDELDKVKAFFIACEEDYEDGYYIYPVTMYVDESLGQIEIYIEYMTEKNY